MNEELVTIAKSVIQEDKEKIEKAKDDRNWRRTASNIGAGYLGMGAGAAVLRGLFPAAGIAGGIAGIGASQAILNRGRENRSQGVSNAALIGGSAAGLVGAHALGGLKAPFDFEKPPGEPRKNLLPAVERVPKSPEFPDGMKSGGRWTYGRRNNSFRNALYRITGKPPKPFKTQGTALIRALGWLGSKKF